MKEGNDLQYAISSYNHQTSKLLNLLFDAQTEEQVRKTLSLLTKPHLPFDHNTWSYMSWSQTVASVDDEIYRFWDDIEAFNYCLRLAYLTQDSHHNLAKLEAQLIDYRFSLIQRVKQYCSDENRSDVALLPELARLMVFHLALDQLRMLVEDPHSELVVTRKKPALQYRIYAYLINHLIKTIQNEVSDPRVESTMGQYFDLMNRCAAALGESQAA
ncbi:hypothetical protein A3712_22640 [Vibrio sp. HI00D65]|uniref:hypothetical protein n=1 Tax=Vibrio sp. HI00D65 TaxID=1822216 RepID=UPI0007BA98A1|nr:hypothetical protein [Vibrio sp. HI00D65]KZX61333.1 hypothetical protein A3712_22640 [Vibrio sp. HI00D65]